VGLLCLPRSEDDYGPLIPPYPYHTYFSDVPPLIFSFKFRVREAGGKTLYSVPPAPADEK
jgi:hypothetical protein